MTKRARLWTGVTLLIVLAINYAIIGVPLMRKSASIKEKANAIFIRQVKSGNMLKSSEEDYVLEIFRKEKGAVDRKILILNCAGLSIAVLIASWTVFGMILGKKRS